MRDFKISQVKDASVIRLFSERQAIHLDPPYQRIGGIWNREARQLLIDSIINGFDIPKLYFHEFVPPKQNGSRTYDYAIIDGKQRLQTIWDFIEGKFALANDFIYMADKSLQMQGMTYAELGLEYPEVKSLFDAYSLDIISIRTDKIERIEDMFSRLNEAAPLNAPEKRNAFGGPLPRVIASISRHDFFTSKVPFADKRYRHRDLSAKALWLEYKDAIVNTKKRDLDSFVKSFKHWRSRRLSKASQKSVDELQEQTRRTLDYMCEVFTDKDKLLRQVGLLTLYLHLYRNVRQGRTDRVGRAQLEWFENLRADNRRRFEEDQDVDQVDQNLLEFDKHSQTPNDSYALKIRLEILLRYLGEHQGIKYQRDGIFREVE